MPPAERFAPEPLSMPNEHLATKEIDTEEIDTESSRVHIETEGSDIMDCVRSCSDRDESVMCTLKELGVCSTKILIELVVQSSKTYFS